MQQTNILRLTNKLLNGSTATGDSVPGSNTPGYTGQVNQYSGQLGAVAFLSFAEAQKRSDSAVTASLQGGRYQYVQHAADGTNYAQGQVLYWKDETNYIVTNVAPSAVSARVAGICIAPVTQGNFWLFQTDGVAQVQFRAAITSAVADNLVVVLVNTNTADAVADATAITAGAASTGAKHIIGTAKALPVNNTITTVFLRGLVQVQ